METQDVPAEFLFKLWPWLEANKTRLIGGGAAIVLVAIIYSFVAWQHGQNEINAGEAFTQLMLTPSSSLNASQEAAAFAELASTYSGTETARRAQLQAASTLFESGNYADAQAQFQKFLDVYSGPLGAVAALGVAASLEAQDKADLAATAYQRVISSYAGSPAALQADFSLGRLAEQQGKLEEAEGYYENAAQAGRAGGTISEEAQGREYQIKMELAAAQKTPPSSLLK
jgi:predicted negative regulator of RcsB-dependent stress response